MDEEPPPPRVTVNLIREVVAAKAGVTVEEIILRSRRQPVVACRKIAMYLAATMTNSPLPDISKRLGSASSSHVMFYREWIAQRIAKEPALRAKVEALKAEILARAEKRRSAP